MVIKEEASAFDDPKKRTLVVHERARNSFLSDTGASEVESVFRVGNDQPAEPTERTITQTQNNFGLFVPNLIVVEDVDKLRYDAKDNRRIQQVAVARVFKKSGSYIF